MALKIDSHLDYHDFSSRLISGAGFFYVGKGMVVMVRPARQNEQHRYGHKIFLSYNKSSTVGISCGLCLGDLFMIFEYGPET